MDLKQRFASVAIVGALAFAGAFAMVFLSAEFFLQDGRQAASLTLYDIPADADGIEFFASGKARMDLQLYDLAL